MQHAAGLKLDHSGLATAAARAGAWLLIQGDIGTRAARLLVLQLADLMLHEGR